MTYEDTNKKATDLMEVNEAIGLYMRQIKLSSSMGSQLEQLTFADFFEDKMTIIRAIRKGIPYTLFTKIKEFTPFSEDDWADYLSLSKKTLQRHSTEKDYYFKPIHSEKIIELAEVTNYGLDVFGSLPKFYAWLNTPSYALDNLNPSELLKDSYGKELVMAELNRIDHGIFA